MKKSVNLTLSLDNMKELKDAIKNQIEVMRDKDYDRMSIKQEIVARDKIVNLENILSGIESAIIHAEMEG